MSSQGFAEELVVSAATATVAVLAQNGVDTVFCNPGTTEIPLIRELVSARSQLRYVLTLHEGAAVSAALGYALATGAPGVAVVHAMPGFANALSMHFDAFKSRIPLLLLVGQQDRRHQYLDPVLYAEMTDVARSVSKQVWEARTAAELPEVIERSLLAAQASPSGPVFVSVPLDVWDEPIALRPARNIDRRYQPGQPPSADVGSVAAALVAAEAPVIVAGDLVGMRRCSGAVAQLAEACGARAYWSPGAVLANFPTSHELYAGQVFNSDAAFRRVFGDADLALLVGANVTGPLLYSDRELVPPSCRIVVVTETSADPPGALLGEIAIHGELRQSVDALAVAVRTLSTADDVQKRVTTRRDSVRESVAASRDRLIARVRSETTESSFSGAAAIDVILDAAPAGVSVVDEGVSNAWVPLLGRFDDELSYVAPGRGGALGFACGAALGVKLALHDRPVLAILGDGAALYGFQALWSIAHEGVPVVICVLNNGGYSILKDFSRAEFFATHHQSDGQGSTDRSEIEAGLSIEAPEVDFVGLAQSFGVSAIEVADAGACRAAVAGAFDSEKPWLIAVRIAS
jgi:benzoylformate decarboxylase